MAWLPSHQSLREHPKKDRLAELLFNGSVPDDVSDLAAIGTLHRLWWWALDYAQDGDLSRFTDRQVAKGCGWQGDPTFFIQSLTDAGFIDKDTRCLHDWGEYVGRLLERRDKSRERAKKWRAEKSERIPNAHAMRDVQPTEQRVQREQRTARAGASGGTKPPARAKSKSEPSKFAFAEVAGEVARKLKAGEPLSDQPAHQKTTPSQGAS